MQMRLNTYKDGRGRFQRGRHQLDCHNLKIVSVHWPGIKQRSTKMPLGSRALVWLNSAEAAAKTKAFVGIAAPTPRPAEMHRDVRPLYDTEVSRGRSAG